MNRNRTLIKNEPRMVKAKVGQTIFLGFLMAALFWEVGDYLGPNGYPT